MHVLSAEDVTKAYEGRPVLDRVRFGLTTDDRIGVVGANGAGKSTLLRVLAGVEAPDAGRITRSADATVVYLPQEAALDPDATPLAEVTAAARAHHSHDATHEDWDAQPRAAAMLDRLGVGGTEARIGDLSGGQRRRVALAGALVGDADLLILDEPTNHLDADAVEWLEGELRRRRGGLLLVTHDRYFLERLCSRMFEVEGGGIHRHEGRYSDMLEARAERIAASGKAEARRRNLLRKEVAWLRRGAKARTSKPRFRLEQAAALMDAATDAARGPLQLGTGRRRLGNDVFELTGAAKAYSDLTVLRDVDLLLGPGERVGIVGPNGAGKTTLLRLLAGDLAPDAGTVRAGRTVEVGFYTQELTIARGDETAISVLREVAEWIPLEDGRKVSASALMERFLFDDAMQHRVTSTFSGGELRRLALCRLLMAAPNVLILDEPTNDLDLDTLAALEDHLDGFKGTIVVASHDRYLLDRLVDTLYGIGPDGSLTKYPGEWAAYREMRASAEARPAKPPAASRDRPRPSTKPSYKHVREHAELEARLPELEARRDELVASIEAAASDHERLVELTATLGEVQAELDRAETRWLELADLVGE